MKDICYISFVSDKDESILKLHSEAIRRFDSQSDIIYFSASKVNVPKGTNNIEGIDIGDRKGFNNLATMLTVFRTLATQYETIVVSNASAILTNPMAFINAIKNKQTFAWYALDNSSSLPNISCFIVSSATIEHIIDYISKTYYDVFNARNCMEVFLFALSAVLNPAQLAISQGVMPDGSSATYAIWSSSLFNQPEKIDDVSVFIECGHLSYLQPYALARLDLWQQIKRAERFILHFLKKMANN